MDPRDFLQIASDLLRSDNPANSRTVFNRSYYAAYNVCVDLLKGAGFRIYESAKGHGQVNNYLGNCGIRDLEEAQMKLANLMSQRIKADYRMHEPSVEKIINAKKAVKTSENIIQIFDSYVSNSEKKKVAKGINDYLKKIHSASKTSRIS